MFLRRYILFFLTLLSLSLQAQQYPVDVQVFVIPPYPQSLRGYADTFEQKIQAHFLLKDLSTGGRPFALRFSLENFQGQTIAQTPDYITPYLVNLSPGVRRTLTNIDFKTLLRYENLYGINEATYNGLLPEGTYFIGLSLYDVATGRPVSNKGRAMIQVRRYSPPVLTMPQKGEVLTKKNAFQNIFFQWMPRDIAPFMQYEFTLKEVWDLALVPEEAFMSGRLVYQTKTNAPALQYTNMMPILLENKRYVWQVRALTNNPANPNEQSYFRNNGNSETFYFDLVSNCEAPRMLTAITESTSAQLRWSAQAMMPNQEYPYKVIYREKGKTWKSQKVSMPYAKLTNLKRGRTYIYKVGVACGLETAYSSSVFGEEIYMYSTEQEFTTTEQIDEKSQVQCGVKPEIRIKNTKPLQDNLYANTTFTAGDFPVTVINATGNNGVYSGEGYVKVPYLQDTKIKVVFNGIKLNTERQLIGGKLVTTYDETERNVVEVPIIKTLNDAINSLKNVGKQQEEIVQNQEKLEKQFSENKIDKEEYDKKTKENISQWEKTLSVYNDVESFTEKHPLITKEEVNELKELQQQKSFAGNSVGKRDLENTKKINAKQTEMELVLGYELQIVNTKCSINLQKI
ncbi:Fibronectin type III domain [Capnocytophaga ochracea]|uniref:Fibronectin type III domain n=1 Tax=Capnocytophaga ochracea TaxID=1018 RepID=A0A7Z8YER5_CAPOC|nr:fibronectin type III domain-containing protein [Capnocytophaga ochracea]VDG82165.1 Fibronectin type III domain [Capnocytophaga ochracea]